MGEIRPKSIVQADRTAACRGAILTCHVLRVKPYSWHFNPRAGWERLLTEAGLGKPRFSGSSRFSYRRAGLFRDLSFVSQR